MFATGFDIRTADKASEVVDRFADTVGIRRLKSLHANDSMTPLGSSRAATRSPARASREAQRGALLSEPLREAAAPFEGPGTSDHAPDRVDVDTMTG